MSISDILLIGLSIMFAAATLICMGLFFVGVHVLTQDEKEDVLQ